MSKKDWENQEIIIGPPGADEDDCLKIPVLGDKDHNMERVMNNAFCNASTLLKDVRSVSEYSKIILASLSCELFLKAIIYKTKNVLVKVHDLYELFFYLDGKEREYLIESFGERNLPEEIADTDFDNEIMRVIDGFEDSLAMNAVCFETIRYKHELGTYTYNLGFIMNFAIDLKRLGTTLGFSDK